MTTSGTTAFSLDIAEILEEAHERAGVELRTGYQFRTAIRSLNLLMIEWGNRGYNLWLIDQESTSLASGTTTLALTTSTVDVINMNIVQGSGTSTTDYRIRRVSAEDYMHIANKATTGRPTLVWVDRQLSGPSATFWPVPDQTYTLKYWRLRRIEDTGTSVATPDVPYRFVPALIAGLAYKLALKTPESMDRVPGLEADYEKAFAEAAAEDREKSSFYIRPRIGRV